MIAGDTPILFGQPAGDEPHARNPRPRQPKRNPRQMAAEFITERPDIYALFVKFSLEKASAGRPFGVKQILERVRWECDLSREQDESFLINNSVAPYLARQLITDHPQLADLIELRRTRW